MAVLKGWRVFFTKFYAVATTLFSAISIFAVFFDIHHYFPTFGSVWAFIAIVLTASLCIAVLWILMFGRSAVIQCNGKKITLKYGDLFKSEAPIKVIAVNRCFDTKVDDRIINRSSLHGQFINRFFENNVAQLDAIIDNALKGVPCDDVSAIKPNGKQMRYAPGTIVPVTVDNGSVFYLLALTEMDSNNNTHCSPEEYLEALCALVEYCDHHANEKSVHMPLIGSGRMSRIHGPKQDKLSAILSVLSMKSESITYDISIIIGKRDKDCVAIDHYI